MKRGKMNKYRPAIFCVVYFKNKNNTEYLVLHRKHHWKGWEFPKGGIKPRESKLEAVKREVKEETGNTPYNIKKFNIQGKYKYKKPLPDRPDKIGQTFSLFSAEIKSKTVKYDKLEHNGHKWLSFKQAYNKLTFPNQKRCLKIVDKNIAG